RRKPPARERAGEVGLGEAKRPGRSDTEAGVRRQAEELDRIRRSVLLIGPGDEGGDRRRVIDQLGLALDDDRLVGVVRGDGALGSIGEVARFARRAARTEPERLIDPDSPDGPDVWPAVGPSGRPPGVVRAYETRARPRPGQQCSPR